MTGVQTCALPISAADAGEMLDLAAIHAAMTGLLPAFAVPAYITQLDTLPRSATLKIDKKALKGAARPGDAWRSAT